MKTWNLDPPVSMAELLVADVLCIYHLDSKGYDWRCLGDVVIDRAKRVMIDGNTPTQVAEEDGVKRNTIYRGLYKAMNAVLRLRRGECLSFSDI